MGNELLIGQIALERKWITQAQLNECLDAQASGSPQPVGAILVDRKLLTDVQLADLIDEQRRRMDLPAVYSWVRREDVLFGKMLVRSGRASERAVHEGLRAQQDLGERGVVKRLGEILIDCGAATREDVERTLRDQGASEA